MLAPCFSKHTTQPRIGGGGRGPYKVSTLSGKEGTEGKLGWASETKVSNVVWEGMMQLNKQEVARIQDKAEAEAKRIQDKAQAGELHLGGSRGLLLLLITSYMHIIIIETYLVQC